MENLVFDTSAILNCGKKGECEFLLERLAGENLLFTTGEVERELRDPVFSHGAFLQKYFKIQSPKTFNLEADEFPQLAAVLSSGELSVLLLGLELDALVIIDDLLVRKAAATLNIRFCSTFRILADGIKRNWCNDEQCTEIVNRLHINGFRMRPRHPNESLFEYLSTDCS